MVVHFKVFKKSCSDGNMTVYLGRRDFVDHVSSCDPIDGILCLNNDSLIDQNIYIQLVCSFRYGSEEDDTIGLSFCKELVLLDTKVYPASPGTPELTKLQERLLKKFGSNCYPFTLRFPSHSPMSVAIQPGTMEDVYGVEYYIHCYVLGLKEYSKSKAITMIIRKIQYAPTRIDKEPCTVVRKGFLMSPGDLELEIKLDKQLYYHDDEIVIGLLIKNSSSKTVKKISAAIVQHTDIAMFTGGHCNVKVDSVDTTDQCPILPGSFLKTEIKLRPTAEKNKGKRGVSLDGLLKGEHPNLASSTLLLNENSKDVFGMVIAYTAKVRLLLGAISGELNAELPLVLMNPNPFAERVIKLDKRIQGFKNAEFEFNH